MIGIIERNKKPIQDLIKSRLVTNELIEGDGIRRIAHENLLIDVKANTNDTILDGCTLQTVLYQYAADFLLTYIDIVWPLDFHLIIYIVLQRLAKRHRYDLCDMKLLIGRNLLRMN